MSVLKSRHQSSFTVEHLTVKPVKVILSRSQRMPPKSASAKVSHRNGEGVLLISRHYANSTKVNLT